MQPVLAYKTMDTPWQRATHKVYTSISSAQGLEIYQLSKSSYNDIPSYYRDLRVPVNAMILSSNISILHILSRCGHAKALEEMCRMVFDNNQDFSRRLLEINITDTNSWTPLHHASFSGHIQAIDVLLRFGGILSIEDSKGRTAKALAKDQDTVDFIDSKERVEAEMLINVKAKLWVMKNRQALFIKTLQPGVLRAVLKHIR